MFEEKFFEIEKNKSIYYQHYENIGKPKILFFHGVSANSNYFNSIFPYFKDDYEIFALDFKGHGKSYYDFDNYNLSLYHSDTEKFIKNIIKNPDFIIGYSMGGRISLSLTIKNPSLCKKLIIVDVGPDIDKAGLQMLIKAYKSLPDFFNTAEEIKDYMRKYRFISDENYLNLHVKHYWKKIDNKFVPNYDPTIWDVPMDKIDEECNYINDGLKAINIPTLIIRGELSNVLNKEDALKFVSNLKKGKLIEIPMATHGVLLEQTEKCVSFIKEFINEK